MPGQLHHFIVEKPAFRFRNSNLRGITLDAPEVEREKQMIYHLIITFENKALFLLPYEDYWTSTPGKVGKASRARSEYFDAADLIGFLRKTSRHKCFFNIQTAEFVDPNLNLGQLENGTKFEIRVIFRIYSAILEFEELLSHYCLNHEIQSPTYSIPTISLRQRSHIQAIYYLQPKQYMSFEYFIAAVNAWPPPLPPPEEFSDSSAAVANPLPFHPPPDAAVASCYSSSSCRCPVMETTPSEIMDTTPIEMSFSLGLLTGF